MHSVTDRRTDRRTDGQQAYANSRSYCVAVVAVRSAKNRLDKFWSDQEVLYDYNAGLHGIGNRSLLNIM